MYMRSSNSIRTVYDKQSSSSLYVCVSVCMPIYFCELMLPTLELTLTFPGVKELMCRVDPSYHDTASAVDWFGISRELWACRWVERAL